MASSVWNRRGPVEGPLPCVLQALSQWRPTKEPLVTLGKRFAVPLKGKHRRAKRAMAREAPKPINELSRSQSPGVSLSSSVTRRVEGPSECGEGSNTHSLPVQSEDAASPS